MRTAWVFCIEMDGHDKAKTRVVGLLLE